jgi:hypothetical protein
VSLSVRTLTDFFWPSAGKPTEEELTKRRTRCDTEKAATMALKDDEAALERALESSRAIIAAEKDRCASVETRLGIILSMAAVATTVVLAFVTFLTKRDIEQPQFVRWTVIAVAIGGAYVVLQLVGAVRAAVNGLARASVRQDTYLSLIPEPEEARSRYLRRILEDHAETRMDLTAKIDHKVTCMAIAHRALMNVTGAMVIAAVFLLATTISRVETTRPPVSDENQLPKKK